MRFSSNETAVDERRGPWQQWAAPALVAAILTPVALLSHSYKFVNDDQILYIPILLRRLNPALYPEDYFFNQPQASISLFEDVLVWPLRWFGMEWTMLAGYLLVQWAILFCLFLLARQINGSDSFKGNAPAYLAMILFLVPISIGGTYVRTFDNYFNPRTMTLPLGLLAMLFLARRRPWPAALIVTAHLLLHPLSGIHTWLLASVMMLWWLGANTLPRRRVLAPLLLLWGMMALLYAASAGGGSELWIDPTWREILWRRTPYVFLASWKMSNWLSLGMYLFVGMVGWAYQRRQAAATQLSAGVLLVVGLSTLGVAAGVDGLGLAPLAQLQLARSWWMVIVLALIFGADLCWNLGLKGRWGSSLAAAMLAVTLFWDRGKEEWLPVIALLLAAIVLSWAVERWGGKWGRWVAEGVTAAAGLSLLLPPLLEAAGVPLEWPLRLLGGDWRLPQDGLAAVLVVWGGAMGLAILLTANRRTNLSGRLQLTATALVVVAGIAAAVSTWAERDIPAFVTERLQAPWTTAWMSSDFRDWRDVQLWAAANTPVDARFATDPDKKGFRVFSQRSPIVEEKDGAPTMFGRDYAVEWQQRMAAMEVTGVVDTEAEERITFDVDGLRALYTVYPFDYVVSRQSQELPWPTVYANDTYVISERAEQ
jgi:hypothetical protein